MNAFGLKTKIEIPGLILLISLASLFNFCKKEKPVLKPDVETTVATEISYTTAVTGGEVTNEGGAFILTRGICWNTSSDPEITNTRTTQSGGLGTFTTVMTQLNPNTVYYVRAYATNIAGTGYGNQISFTTNNLGLPELTTTQITSVTKNTASSGGNITADNGGFIESRGVCWSTSHNPSKSDNQTSDNTGTGSYASIISGLSPNTIYYVRAFATNSVGTSYGNELSFKTYVVTDADGNNYYAVMIGTQTWMAENLKTTRYRNSELISTTIPPSYNISNETNPKYQWAYNGDEGNADIYGRLYTWDVITDNRNVCPSGWHIPTNAEWATIASAMGDITLAGGKLKETGLTHWISPNTGATNETGFTALPAGIRSPSGTFAGLGYSTQWWSSTEDPTYGAWEWEVTYYLNALSHGPNYKQVGLSVRCLKD